MAESLALLAAFSFGCANVMVKKGTKPNSINNGTFLSILITFFLAGGIALGKGLLEGWVIFTAEGIWWFILAGILTAFIGRTHLFTSIQHLGSVRASAIKRLNPLFAVLIGIFFLHEALNTWIIIGIICIFGSSVVLMYESFIVARKNKKNVPASKQEKAGNGQFNKLKMIARFGYVYGVISAFAYAIGYVVRKEGLEEMPDPYMGTMIGALVGILVLLILSLFQKRYRQSIQSTFSSFQPWLFGAGIATSLGQILYFAALSQNGVSQVAVIASTDVIFTLFLSSMVFKTNEAITKKVIFASITAMVGAGLIASV
ncbi:DMT family transporter [Fictibacillus terranigra]|uniref:EamA family transporter n=1 Tax=Fictibacillus terranigra TaxID=3058424 RepID=A0ABT8EBZ3_9BACL|nr:EamA family transporter [Fictibacillus sp. CENA-BCM004]MDN4075415.1 EamA family transporter [Fictibacillus sp. CENA-BCM004]